MITHLVTIMLLGLVLTSCESPPVKSKPLTFQGKYEANIDGVTSTIHIQADGNITYINLPFGKSDEGHYKHISGHSSWELVPPERTPGGIWSLHFDHYYFRFYDNKDGYKLLYPYDVTYRKDAWYVKPSK